MIKKIKKWLEAEIFAKDSKKIKQKMADTEVEQEICNNACKSRLDELERLEKAKKIGIKRLELLGEVSSKVYRIKESLLDKIKLGTVNIDTIAKVNKNLADICGLLKEGLSEEAPNDR